MRALFAAGSNSHQLAEIDEELLFHLRSRVEDNRAAGMSEDEAWEDARRRLGSYQGSVDECRDVRFGSGRRILVGIGAAVVLLAAGGWLVGDWRAKGLLAQQTAITQKLDVLATAVTQTAAAVAEAGPQDLEVLVTEAGRPVKDADVLLILKSWPNNRYRQEPSHAKTGDDGKARFEKLIPAEGQFAVHAAIVHEGSTLTSAYHLFKADKRQDLKAIKPLAIEVGKAQTIRFQLVDAEGKPLANAHVAPASRKTDKDEHIVYFDASAPATVVTRSDGEVTLSCFARGDKVKLFVTPIGRRATEAACTIPKEGNLVKVTVAPPQKGE